MKITNIRNYLAAGLIALAGSLCSFGNGEIFLGRARTRDDAFKFRMLGGIPGSVTRSHPMSIEPCLIDATAPPTYYGQGVIADGASPNGVRVPASGDSAATSIYGITVRTYPTQQQSGGMSAAYGGGAPPITGEIDILRRGYIIVTLQGAAAAFKGSPVKMCIVAGTGYAVGGFSVDSVSGTFITLDASYTFNGPADASGNVELCRA